MVLKATTSEFISKWLFKKTYCHHCATSRSHTVDHQIIFQPYPTIHQSLNYFLINWVINVISYGIGINETLLYIQNFCIKFQIQAWLRKFWLNNIFTILEESGRTIWKNLGAQWGSIVGAMKLQLSPILTLWIQFICNFFILKLKSLILWFLCCLDFVNN